MLLPQRLHGVLAFSTASNFRLVFFIIRSIYHDGTSRLNYRPGPKSGVHFRDSVTRHQSFATMAMS